MAKSFETQTRVQRRAAALVALLIASTLAVTGCIRDSARPTSSTQPPTPEAPTSRLTGTSGAVNFDEGYIAVGTGPTVVDLYLDPMCPYCKMFEATSGQLLFDEAEAGRATLHVHPVAILDRLSVGTSYSTRAAATMVDVAAQQPELAQNYLAALYRNQPPEDTPGLSDSDLAALASEVGARLSDNSTLRTYQLWVQEHTARDVRGPLLTSDVPALQSVPTVIISGRLYPGNSDEAARFAEFYRAKRSE
nr:thioredoxin domain-containing protein [Plantibacter sp. VKM Ac-2885]